MTQIELSRSSSKIVASQASLRQNPSVGAGFEEPTKISSYSGLRLLLFMMLYVVPAHAGNRLITYPVAPEVAQSKLFDVRVRSAGGEWQHLDCYAPEVNMRHPTKSAMVYFDFEGVVEVAVTPTSGELRSARIRPLSFGITSILKNNTVRFLLDRPRNLSIEANGDTFANLHLFAGAPQPSVPDRKDPNVLYFGPGFHDVGGKLVLKSGQTLYLAGGAVLRASVVCDHVHDVHILGRGILYQAEDGVGVRFSDRVDIRGIIVMNPNHYAVLAGNTTRLTVSDLKSFSSRGWGDGIDIFSSKHVLIDGVFMRNSDDTIAIYGHRWNFTGDVDDVVVQNSVLWPDVAHPIIVGTHGDFHDPETLGNLAFRNIDILQQDEPQIDYQGCIALNASDGNLIRHVVVDDVRIEDISQGQLFNPRVMFNKKYASGPGRGIEDIVIRNVVYNGTHANMSVISGYDDTRAVRGVRFENLRVNGTVISDDMSGKPPYFKTGDMANIYVAEHVESIQFLAPGARP
jgi:hypothetical protein